jgi:uncharacterized lipoprotein NlpE involved in copper resistance
MKHSLVAAAAAVVLSLTGCASSDATPGPAAAVMTVEEAGRTYQQLSAPSNAAREAWMSAAAPTTSNLAEHKKLAASAADATVAFSRGLREHRWPDQAQRAVTALDKHLQEREAAYRRVAAANTVTAYLVAAAQVPVTTGLTGDVREALGLPEGAVVTGAVPRKG